MIALNSVGLYVFNYNLRDKVSIQEMFSTVGSGPLQILYPRFRCHLTCSLTSHCTL